MRKENILLIRTGGLGDTLLLWPALQSLRKRFPQAQIDLMGHPERCSLLVVAGGADRAIDADGSGLHRMFDLWEEPQPELTRRFGGYHRVVAFASPGDYSLAENLSACGVGEVHAFLPFPPSGERVHVADHTWRSLQGLNMATEDAEELLPVTEPERLAAQAELARRQLDQAPLVLLAPGSGSRAKNWLATGFAEMVRVLRGQGLLPVLIEGPADEEAVAQVQQSLGDETAAVLAGLSLARIKPLVAAASLFIGNDSGLSHLAAMLGTPSVAVFGPTDPELWRPRGPKSIVVSAPAACAPCSPDQMRQCSQRICIEDVSVAQVKQACASLQR